VVTPTNTMDPVVPTPEQVIPAIDQPVTEPVITPAPVVTPVAAEKAVPEPVSPTPEVELETLRRQLAQVKAARDAEITEATLQRTGQAVYDEEIAAGLSHEDALRIAKRHYATSRQAMAQQQVERDRQAAAEFVGRKFKVDPRLLMTGTSGEHMETIAEMIVMRKRIEVLEKGQVPAQKMDGANSARASNVAVTADNIDKLWFDFEVQHPGQTNPYDAAYRKVAGR